MKRIIFCLSLFVFVQAVYGQQDHQYTQFMYNKLMLNPGYAGARGVPSINGIFRSQWIGFDGAPQSQLLSFNSPFINKRVGIGATVSHRKIGLDRDLLASLAYSYDLLNNSGNMVRFGLQGSMRNIGIDLTQANPVVGVTIDPSLQDKKVNDLNFNVGAGIYASFQDLFYVGVSLPQILKNTYGLNQSYETATEVQHIYGMAGAAIPISADLVLMPSILTKYVKNVPFDADLNLSLGIKERVTAGVSYRLGGDGKGESVDLLMLVNLTPQLGIGAAYDFPLSQLKDHTSGSFEVSAFYDLRRRESNNGKVNLSNPRFFF